MRFVVLLPVAATAGVLRAAADALSYVVRRYARPSPVHSIYCDMDEDCMPPCPVSLSEEVR